MLARMKEVEAIFFDAGRTLLYAHPSVGELYARAAARQGRAVTAETMEKAFTETWRRRDHELIGKEFWRRTVYATMEQIGGVADPEACFQELWRVFADPEVWRLYDDVPPTLRELRRRGFKLGLLSNWDYRLRGLIAGTALDKCFDTLIISEEVGVEKPHPRIFELALGSLQVSPAHALHVGDSYREDYLGARAMGMHAILLERHDESMPQHPPRPDEDNECRTIHSLTELLTVL